MNWWDAAASLAAVAAWDAARADATTLTDGVGANTITRTAATALTPFLALGVCGNGNPMALATPVAVPANGVVAALWTCRRRNALLSRAYGDTTYYLLRQDEATLQWRASKGSAGSYGTDTRHRINKPVFAAVVTRGTDSVLYVDGDWFGVPVDMACVPAQIGVVGYGNNGNEYNLDADEMLHGLGVWTGTPSLQNMRDLEAALRAAVAGAPMTTHGFFEPLGTMAKGPLPMQPGRPPGTVPIAGVLGRRNSMTAPTGFLSGTGYVEGTVAEKNTPINTPLARRVVLLDERRGVVVAETWSDAVTGAYRFDDLDRNQRYSVIAYDHQHNYRAVIADDMAPEFVP